MIKNVLNNNQSQYSPIVSVMLPQGRGIKIITRLPGKEMPNGWAMLIIILVNKYSFRNGHVIGQARKVSLPPATGILVGVEEADEQESEEKSDDGNT